MYRVTDFRSNGFRNLRGGELYEPVEHNPMIGYRGCFRYIEEPELFNLGLQAGAGRNPPGQPQSQADDSVRAHPSGNSSSAWRWSTPARWAHSADCTGG